ncbi:MAG: cobaltochelatase subunit CobN [Thermodesulfobacterium sp.]|nr:cobaltochelatase subunit CobN [Thermodesulfobacterium sp.]
MIFLWLLILFSKAWGKKDSTLKISFLLGDLATKPLSQAIKEVKKELPLEIYSRLQIKVYPQKNLKNKDLDFLKNSNLIIINLMGRQIYEMVKEELKEASLRGAQIFGVYALGSYDEEMKNLGIQIDPEVEKYNQEGGLLNYKNLLFYLLKEKLGFQQVSYQKPFEIPELAIYDCASGNLFTSYEEFWSYQKKTRSLEDLANPWIGILFYKLNYTSAQMEPICSISLALQKEGFNVISAWGYPSERVINEFFLEEGQKSRLNLLIAFALKVGVIPKSLGPVLERLDVPVINVISLYRQSQAEWENSPIGLDIFERTWQIFNPELVGIIQPMVVAAKELRYDEDLQEEVVEEVSIPERIETLVKRVKAWINLQKKKNSEKRIAIIYYNYPPGKQNIGASYLKVLPDTLAIILDRLKVEGYWIGEEELDKELLFSRVLNYGRNIAKWAPSEIEKLVKEGKPVLIPFEKYKRWFFELPEKFRIHVIKDWGEPEKAEIMTWKDAKGEKFFIIPAINYGNILLTPQPSKAWEQALEKAYHQNTLAPHHQYIAFYLWLKKEFQADAVIHLGTHGTHEWFPGKEVGFTAWDDPEVLIQDLPNIYPYIVDNVGEGLQAKRRGLAVIIDHMTPPLSLAFLNPDLKNLKNLLQDWEIAKEKNPLLAEGKLKEITALVKKMGLLKDLGLDLTQEELIQLEDIKKIENYLNEIEETVVPYGLHVFGKAPEKSYVEETAKAIVNVEKNLTEEERKAKVEEYIRRIYASAERELNFLVRALEGRYVPAGSGNDPIRNPDSLPTGKNFYAFDPSKIPSPGVFEMGQKLAEELIENYKLKHKKYPEKVAFVLWAVETIRHEGIMESQILSLLGVKPKWDERGRVVGLELIPREKLKRNRIDVVITTSGLYRDLFSNLVYFLDQAISLANSAKEKDNLIRINTEQRKKLLEERGISPELAERLAKVRIFSEESGSYGTGLDTIISASHSWKSEKEVAEVYLKRISFIFGQGFWGEKMVIPEENQTKENLNLWLFKNNLSGTKVALHSLSTSVFGTLDNDDFFQYLGGLTLAIRTIDGKSPEVMVTNLSNPLNPRQESLAQTMGRELRSRYFNPEWIKVMLKEGYAGARLVDKIVEHLWGFQVTNPEIVDHTKWQEMYEIYVLDKYELNVKEAFKRAQNLWAYQSILARILETIRKGYWKPSKEVVERLAQEVAQSAIEVGLACCEHTCNNPLLSSFIASILIGIPGEEKRVVSFQQVLKNLKSEWETVPGKDERSKFNPQWTKIPGFSLVKGYILEEIKDSSPPTSSSAPLPYLYILGFLILSLIFLKGFKRKIFK